MTARCPACTFGSTLGLCRSNLRPGGYLEQNEFVPVARCDDDQFRPDAHILKLSKLTPELGRSLPWIALTGLLPVDGDPLKAKKAWWLAADLRVSRVWSELSVESLKRLIIDRWRSSLGQTDLRASRARSGHSKLGRSLP